MRGASSIFICGDTIHRDWLEQLSERLRKEGSHVIRGPDNDLGKLRSYDRKEASELLGSTDVAVFTVRHRVSRSVMEAAPHLRGVVFPTIGVESLDLDAANDMGILVGHGATPENYLGMAEATLMLILALLYDLPRSLRTLRDNLPKPSYPSAQQLRGKTVGIIGFGRIGRALAANLSSFGVTMLIFSPRVDEASLPPYARHQSLDAVLKESDVVCLLVTANPETRGMIGARELRLMKTSAFLVNTSRGEVVDEVALCTTLSERQIAGAALDTFVTEPLPVDSPLRRLPNVILTPHMVGQTRESQDAFVPAMHENIRRLLNDEMPLYCKNPQAEAAWRLRLVAAASLTE